MIKRFYLFLPVLLLLIGGAYEKVEASHAAAIDLSYSCLGNGQYRIDLVFYRSCEPGAISPPSSASVDISSSCFNQTVDLGQGPIQQDTVSQTCNTVASFCNPSGSYPGYEKLLFSDTVTLDTTCSDYTISYDLCCRNDAITNLQNPDTYDTYIETTLDPTLSNCNSSPFFTSTPVPFICAGEPFNYNQGAVDPDGDSLVFNLINPLDGPNTPIPHSGGNTATDPMATNGAFNFNNNTGQMSFTPSGQQQAVVTVEVEEYRNGQLIGTTMRDIQFSVISCSNNQPTVIDTVDNLQGGVLAGNNNVEACPGDSIAFSIDAYDPDAGDSLFLSSNVATAIPGASFNVTGDPTDTLTGNFEWVPTGADTGKNILTLTVEDDACPIEGKQTYAFNIFVRDGTFASPDSSSFCPAGGPNEISVVGGNQFSWKPDSGIVNANSDSSKIWVAPSAPTVYYVESDLSSVCKNKDTVFVDTVPNFNYTVSNDDSICLNQSSQLNVQADPNNGPYTYNWSPGNSLNDGTISNPVASPSSSTMYDVTVTSQKGCIVQDSVNVEVVGAAPTVTASVNKDTVCPGETVELDYVPCQGQPIVEDFDPGVDNSFWSSLNNVNANGNCGSVSGSNSLWFNSSGTREAITVDLNTSGGSTLDFYIKEGTGSGSTCESPDIDEHMELAFSNNAGATWTPIDTYFTGNYPSFTLIQVNLPGGAQTNSTRFRFQQLDNTGSGYDHWAIDDVSYKCCGQSCGNFLADWKPSSLIDTTINNTTFATVPNDTTFTVNVDNGNGCIGSASVDVTVDNSLSIDAGDQIGLCGQQSANINVSANGTPPPINLNCGPNSTPCPDSSTTINTFGSASTTTGQPSPYRGGTKARMQFIYRGSELTSQGVQEGVISALAFDVATKNSTAPYESINIKMGCTTKDTLSSDSGYVSNLQLVYSDSSYTTSTGWNIHEFDQTFDWDGNSNLIIEVCYSNPSGNSGGGGASDLITTTPTSYPSSIFTDDSFAPNAGCSMNASALTQYTSNRPDLQFHMCPPPPGDFIVDWTPSDSLSDSTSLNPVASPDSTVTYTVNVSDVQGCSASDQITVEVGCLVEANLNVQYSNCTGSSNNGTAWVNPSGGDTPYSVLWSDSSTTDTIKNLTPGDYSVTVTDSNGAVAVDSFTLTQPVEVVIDSFSSQQVLCNGDSNGSATVYASGGTTGLIYDWSSGDTTQTATNLPTGSYNVTVTDSLGCADTGTVTVNEPAPLTLTAGADSTSCYNGNDGVGYVSVTGGTSPYNYQWDNGVSNSDTATGLTPGPHTVVVTDSAGCIDSSSVVVDDPPRNSFQTDSTSTSCGGYSDGSATVTPTSGTPPYSYQWSSGDTTQTADSLSSGTYSFTFTDADGCSVTDSVFVPQPTPIDFDVDSVDISCKGADDGKAWVSSISGGTSPYTVDWSNGASADTISGLSADSYTVSVTDDSGCVMMDTAVIDEPDTLTIRIVDSMNVSCNGGADGSATFDIAGGTKPYVVQSNVTSNDSMIMNLSAGTYSVGVVDSNGCIDSANVTISEPPTLTSTIDTVIDVACYGDSTGSVTVSANGGTSPYNYSWSDPDSQNTATANGLSAGSYNVTVTDDSGCVVVNTATVTQPDSFQVDFSVVERVSCYGANDAVVLASIGGDTTKHTFVWSNDTGALTSGLGAGNHVVTVTTDSSGCQQTASVTLNQPDSINVSTSSTSVSCQGGSDGTVSASASGGNGPPFTYIWSTTDTAQSVNGVRAGTYTVTAIDTNGCSTASTVTVNEPSTIQLTTSTTQVSCNGGTDGQASVSANGGVSPYSYSWNDADGQTTSTADDLEAGTYSVTVTDDNGCQDTASVAVTQPEGIEFKETDIVDESCPEAEDGAVFVKARGGTPPYNYSLEGEGESSEGSFNGLEGGRDYELTISDGNNCDQDSTIEIDQPEELAIDFEKDRVTVELGQGKRLNPIILPEDNGGYSYAWEPSTGLNCVDCPRPVANPYSQTVYELTVFDEDGCSYNETITVQVENPEVLYIPNAFTPDDNEQNDEFRVYGKAINKIDLKIFDRWGEKMFETQKVEKGWDGTLPSGEDAPTGVYVYSVTIQYIDGTTKEKQGSLTLIR